jgi:cytochrome P450
MALTVPGFILPPLAEVRWPSIVRVLCDPERHWPREILERPLVRLDIGERPVVMVADPEAFRTILVDRAQQFPRAEEQGRLLRRFLGDSVMTAQEADLGPHRRRFATVFGAVNGADRVPAMVAATESLVRKWGGTASIDTVAEATLVSLDIMWRCLLDDTPRDAPDPVIQHLAAMMAEHPFGLADVASMMNQLTDRLAEISSDGTEPDPSSLLGGGDATAARRIALDNTRLFLQAGQHTMSASIAWALLLLAGDPTSQERARAEIDAILGDGPPRIDQIRQLKALREIVDETLRLFPPAALPRLAGEDLFVDGERVPAGACIILNFFALHRHRHWWQDPDRFDPLRFAAGTGEPRHPHAYQPFGSGPRGCVAAHFAMTQLMTVLAVILRDTRLETATDAAPTARHRLITLPADSRVITVTNRKGELSVAC